MAAKAGDQSNKALRPAGEIHQLVYKLGCSTDGQWKPGRLRTINVVSALIGRSKDRAATGWRSAAKAELEMPLMRGISVSRLQLRAKLHLITVRRNSIQTAGDLNGGAHGDKWLLGQARIKLLFSNHSFG